MALIERSFAPSAVRGMITNRSWLGDDTRASAIALHGFIWDSALLPPPPEDGRAYLVFPLVGSMHLVDVGETVGPGRGVLFPSAAQSFAERTVVVGPHTALALRVDPRVVVDPMAARIFPIARAPVADTHAAIGAGDEVAIRRALRDLADVLVDTGVLAEAEIDRPLPRDPSDRDVARALSRALTFGSERPAMVDLELALCERHARRRVDAFLKRHHMPFARWRDMRQSFNLTGAVLTLTLPYMTTEAAANALGFASSTSLCHALQRAGLETPQAIAKRVREVQARIG